MEEAIKASGTTVRELVRVGDADGRALWLNGHENLNVVAERYIRHWLYRILININSAQVKPNYLRLQLQLNITENEFD